MKSLDSKLQTYQILKMLILRLSYVITTVTSFKKRLRIVVINSQVNVSTSWFSLNSLGDLFAIGIWKQSIELFMFVYLCARQLTFFFLNVAWVMHTHKATVSKAYFHYREWVCRVEL